MAGLSDFLADQRATYTINEAAGLLGISRSTAYECAHTGQHPVLRFGRRLLVTRVTLLQLLDIDTLASNDEPNERGRPRLTRLAPVADPPGPGEPPPHCARPLRYRPPG